MSVTVFYNSGYYTFPDLNDPEDAFDRLAKGDSGNSSGGSNNNSASSGKLSADGLPKGIDPDLLVKNADWQASSKTMFKATEGADFGGTPEELGRWGLERMAKFNYNLTLGTIPDAVSLKYAPQEQKEAFLYMMEAFDKVEYSWGGLGRAIKNMALDPSTYVGLSTLGLGTAAAKSAGFAGKEAIKASLKVGAYGAIEGGIYGAVSEGAQERAKENASDGAYQSDWSKIGFGAAVGAGAGAVLGPLAAVGANKLFGKAADEVVDSGTDALTRQVNADVLTPTPPSAAVPTNTIPEQQLSLDLVDRNLTPDVGDAGAQARMDRAASFPQGVPEGAQQGSLDMDLPFERRLDAVPENAMPPVPRETAGQMEERLMDKWGVDNQLSMDVSPAPAGPRTYDGQGSLFDNLPNITEQQATARRKVLDDEFTKLNAKPEDVKAAESLIAKSSPEPGKAPDNPIDGAKITLKDLKQLIIDLGSDVAETGARSLRRLNDIADPLSSMLARMSPDQAKMLARELQVLRTTDPEYLILQKAAISAENTLLDYIKSQNKYVRELSASNASKEMVSAELAKSRTANDTLTKIQPLTNQLSSTSGQGLNMNNQRFLRATNREEGIEKIAIELGLDVNKPGDYLKAADALFKKIDEHADRSAASRELGGLKAQLANVDPMAPGGLDRALSLSNEIALKKAELDADAALNQPSGINSAIGTLANAVGGMVLGPSSLLIGVGSNAVRTVIAPMQKYISRGVFDEAALREMLHTYHVMASIFNRSMHIGKLSFNLGQSITTGQESEWLKRNMTSNQLLNRNASYQAFEHHFVNFFYKALSASDEVFLQLAYHGFVEGEAVFKAVQLANKEGVKGKALEAKVTKALEDVRTRALDKKIDATVVGQVRIAGIQRGLRGEELNLYIKNTINNNNELFVRANDEQGIHYVNDLLFRRDFSGDSNISSVAKSYEDFVNKQPWMKLVGQLFFRTPVRVFEAGIRMTPGLNLLTSPITGNKFLNDLKGLNGTARELQARGEMVISYGIGMGVLTAYANGNITGSGGGVDFKQERHMGDNPEWKPYSIKIGDNYLSYRNWDPFATPLKIMVNFFENNQFAVAQQRRVADKPETDIEAVGRTFLTSMKAIYGAVRDANLTSGITEIDRLAKALADPERNETALQRFVGSKAQLLVPNAARRAVRFFGEGQDVANDAVGFDQVFTGVLSPGSDTITHQYDALGYKRSNITQGFLGYMGIDVSDAEGKGLSEKDRYSLREIARMSYLSGAVFVPSPKLPEGNKDLREMRTQDGQSTIYNRAMQEFNKTWPDMAYTVLKSSEGIQTSIRGRADLNKGLKTRDAIFRENMNRVWNSSLQLTLQKDRQYGELLISNQNLKMDTVLRRPINAPF